MKLLGKGHDPEFWANVRENEIFAKYRSELHEYWDKHIENYEIAALPYSKWKMFWDSGDRGEFEGEYFRRRYAFEHTFILSLVYPEENKYINKLMDIIFAICDEYTWCLPAHQQQNERNDNSRVDLFASETALHLSLAYVLLGDRLDSLIRDRIRVEIDRRVISTYLGCENYGWWEVGRSNWTAVCVGSLGCTMMLIRPELMTEQMINRLTTAMQGYIDGFADDGICTEGCGYWAYGVSFFVMFADMIKTYTEGKIDYFKIPKIKAIATFPQKMFLSEKASVSFADGPTVLEYTMGVMHRLKSEYPDDVLIYSPEYGNFDIGCGRASIRLFGAIWMNEEYYLHPADNSVEFEEYAECAQWVTKRTHAYGFAAKAGHNAEMHNHNDVGSFIFAKNGQQLLMDVGAGRYTRQYFSAERYDIFEPSSRSHNVPIINGGYQYDSREAEACDVKYEKGIFSMDISRAYKCDGLNSLRRIFTMGDESVSMLDVYDRVIGVEVVERLVSYIEPKIISTSEIAVGECVVTYDPAVCTLSIGGENDSEKGRYCYFMDFRLNADAKEFKVVMR